MTAFFTCNGTQEMITGHGSHRVITVLRDNVKLRRTSPPKYASAISFIFSNTMEEISSAAKDFVSPLKFTCDSTPHTAQHQPIAHVESTMS
jgi:hypothetical protein